MEEYKYNKPDKYVSKEYITKDGHNMFLEDVVYDIRCLQIKGQKLQDRLSAKEQECEKLKIKIPTHVYCEVCDSIQEGIFEALDGDAVGGGYLGGDILCKQCKLVVATVWRKQDDDIQEAIHRR